MTLSRLLMKPLDKMDFSKVRKNPRYSKTIQGRIKKPKILGENPRSGNTG